ncbi:MAG: hypothetical protein WA971_14650 [Microbacterium sp.]
MILLVLLGVLSVAVVVGTFRLIHTDGYRAIPTDWSRVAAAEPETSDNVSRSGRTSRRSGR